MAIIKISKIKSFDYDNEYNINITTTKKLTKDEFSNIVNAIKIIESVFDAYINALRVKK